MSVNDREATMGYDNRRRHLERYLKALKSGRYHDDLAKWADDQGLCTRTAKQYWQRAVWKGLIVINGDQWIWVAKESPDDTESKENMAKMEKRFNVDKMQYEFMPKEDDANAIEYLKDKEKAPKLTAPPDSQSNKASFTIETNDVNGAKVTTGTFIDLAELRRKLRERKKRDMEV